MQMKEDAVPSEFGFGHEAKKQRLSSENCLGWRRHEEVTFLQYSTVFTRV